jgi:lysophospholipase L1-like esterase
VRAARSRRLVTSFLAIAAVLLALLAAELGARVWVAWRHHGNPDVYTLWNTIYEAHPHSAYRPRPSSRFSIFGGAYRVETDSNGFRSPEVGAVKAPGTYRIAFLGGSTTFNSEARDNDDTVPLRSARLLREARPELEVEVINAGTPGYTTMESLTTLVSRVLPLEPDLLVVYEGINDAVYRARGAYRRDYRREPQPLRTRFDSWLYRRSVLFRWINYRAARSWASPRVPLEQLRRNLGENSPEGFERNLRSMLGVARAHGIDVLLCSVAYCPDESLPDRDDWRVLFDAVDEQNALVEQLAKAEGVPFLDLARLHPRDCSLFTNQFHRNSEGLRAHAEILSDFLLESGLLPASD